MQEETGRIVADLDGKIIQSFGDLTNDHETAHSVLQILKASRLTLRSAPLKRIEIASGDKSILVTIANNNIFIVRINNGSVVEST
eukprot:gene1842-4940_t